MANSRISQLPAAGALQDSDLFAVVQNTGSGLLTTKTSLNDLKINIISTGSSLNYKGTWDASTNTPAIPPAGPGNKGWYYVVNVGGTQNINGTGNVTYAPTDWIVSNGVNGWDKIDNSDTTGANFIDISHAALLSSISSASLIPGAFYRINDYQTVHVINETSDINTGPVEPLICLALKNNVISGFAYSEQYPLDIIEYDVNDVLAEDTITARKGKIIYRKDIINNLETWYDFRNVKFRRWQIDGTGMTEWQSGISYVTGQNVYEPGSGIIYKALTSHTSSVNFYDDFGPQSYKWMIVIPTFLVTIPTAWRTTFSEFGDVLTANPSISQDYTTFTDNCKNISIPKANIPYNNIVFLNDTNTCTLGANCSNMSIGGNFYATINQANVIGDNCSNIILYSAESCQIDSSSGGIILSVALAIKIGVKCSRVFMYIPQDIVMGEANNDIGVYGGQNSKMGSWNRNVFLRYADNTTMGNSNNVVVISSFANTLGNANVVATIMGEENLFQNYSYNTTVKGTSNSVGNNSYNNTVAGNFNRIGNACGNNNIQNNSNYNDLLDNCTNNLIDSSNKNILDDGTSNNSFQNNSNNNHIGINSSNNTFDGSSSDNKLGNNCTGNAFFLTSVSNTLGNNCVNNILGGSVNRNILGDYCHDNNFSNSSIENILGANCSSNNIIFSSSSNILGNDCSSNSFSDNSVSNHLGNGSTNNSFTFGSSYNVLEDASTYNTFATGCNYNHLGKGSANNSFTSHSTHNHLYENCSYNSFFANTYNNTLFQNCASNIIGLNGYLSTINNTLHQAVNNCTITGSNNTLEANCTFIVCQFHMIINQCYFSAGVHNITLAMEHGAFITGLRIMLPNNTSTSYTLTEGKFGSLTTYNYKSFDKRDSAGDLWATLIDTAGVMTTEKLASN